MHTWPPVMRAIQTLLSIVTMPGNTSDTPNQPEPENLTTKSAEGTQAPTLSPSLAAAQNSKAAAAAANATARTWADGESAAAPAPAPAPIPTPAHDSAAGITAALGRSRAEGVGKERGGGKVRAQTRQGNKLMTEGQQGAQLKLRARCMAPLHRLFQAW